MSNFLAIATVTATLRYVLSQIVSTDFTGAHVTVLRPDAKAVTSGPNLNIYLYQVTPNAALRNSDLPARRSDGTLLKKPQAALDLHYLFTCYGDDSQYEPQRLLGILERTLHAQPILSRQEINQAIASMLISDPYIAKSNLAAQFELVRFTPSPLTLEELGKIWSIFYQIPYALSAIYRASVVLIESDDTPQSALPVAGYNVYAIPFRQPVIERVESQAGAGRPILPTSTLVIRGSGLLATITLVQFATGLVVPQKVTDTEISLPVPAGLPAGVQGLQVIQKLPMGTPAQPHAGFESNVAAFVLCPVISSPTVNPGQIGVTIAPTARKDQRVTLLLNEATSPPPPAPAAYSFSLPPLPADTATLTFPVTGVKGGNTTYFLRVRIDGAESPVDLDPNSGTFGPTVTIP